MAHPWCTLRGRSVALAVLLLSLGALRAARAQADSTVETGTLQLFKFKQPIGEERYRISRDSSGLVLTTAFEFTDRFRRVTLATSLETAADLTPRHFANRGMTSRWTTTDVEVDVRDSAARVRSDSTTVDVPVNGPAFAVSGYAPIALQQELIRYWDAHGRPAALPTLPGGVVRIEERGADTVPAEGRDIVLRRLGVAGLIWGRETLWFDGDRLAAAVTTDAEFDHFEALREEYVGVLDRLVTRAAEDAASALAAAAASAGTTDSGAFALIGATLVDGTGRPPVRNAVVVVRDGRITAAGPRARVAVPRDAAVVDVAGATVLPGLWDMHAHFEQVEWGPIYLAAGVTTARDVGNEFEFIKTVRDAIAGGQALGPRLLLAGIIDGKAAAGWGVNLAGTPEDGVRLVDRYHDAGFQQIKIYSSVQLPVLEAITREAHRFGMSVTGHIPKGLDAYQGVSAGMDQINHVQYVYDVIRPPASADGTRPPINLAGARARRAIVFLRAHHTVVDPTLAIEEWILHPAREPFAELEPGVLKVAPELRAQLTHAGAPPEREAAAAERLKDLERIVLALHRAGVPIVAGTDQTVPGYSLHRELELYVAAGFTPMEAIQAATIVPARVMHLDREVGTVTAGKRADLLVVDGDPLRRIADLRRVRLVVANGRRYDPAPLWRSVGFTP
jgi:imidazolonepropionase-like amidohydrolase